MVQKLNSKVTTWVSKKLKNKIDEYSKNEGINSSIIVRKALVRYLKENKVIDKEVDYL